RGFCNVVNGTVCEGDSSQFAPPLCSESTAFEAARLIVGKGTEIPPHGVAGPVILHCLEGRVRSPCPARRSRSRRGNGRISRGTEHSVHGDEDSVLLLTILFDGG